MSLYKILPEKLLKKAATNPDGITTLEIQHYAFSFAWVRPAIVSLYLLQAKTKQGTWHPIITSSIQESDGEISVRLANCKLGLDITVAFGAMGITDINNASIFVTNLDSQITRKLLPKEAVETKDLKKSERWDDSFTFTTF